MSKNIKLKRKQNNYFLHGWKLEELLQLKSEKIPTKIYYTYEHYIYMIASMKENNIYIDKYSSYKENSIHHWDYLYNLKKVKPIDKKNLKKNLFWVKKKDFEKLK
jgi:hypothetical protein